MSATTDPVDRLFAQALADLQAGRHAAAASALRQALALAPEIPELHANLALTLEQQGDLAAAASAYQQALILAPTAVQIHVNHGVLLARQKRFSAAEQAYQQALQLDPDHPGAWTNLGVLYASLHQDAAAEECHRQALAIAPDHRSAQFNLAYLLLRQGRWREGWTYLEARDSKDWMYRDFNCRPWQGEALAGKRILIGAEAGYGDMLHFARYAQVLKEAGAAHVGIVAYPGLERLFASLKGADQVLAWGSQFVASDWDFWIAPLSLPRWFATTPQQLPATVGYLSATAEDQARWAARLPPARGYRVGLVWCGNPNFANDQERSLPLPELLAAIRDLPACEFFALQPGALSEALPDWVQPLGTELGDFADSAGLLMHLDLLISVDTAFAHLAGALGRPCHLLLPAYQTDWRWLQSGDTSPWYPGSLRLFRQKQRGDWPPVLAELRQSLRDLLARKQPAVTVDAGN